MPTESRPSLTLILFSGDFDKAMAAFTLANGAAGQGMDVSIFFTFWGLNIIRARVQKTKNPLENLFKKMMPVGPDKIGLSKMNFAGIGPWLMKRLIRQKEGQTVADLVKMSMERHVKFIACEASLNMLGLSKHELIAYERLEIGDVKTFLNNALQSRLAMFI